MNKGIVAAGHPITGEAASEVLKAGGNAFDAAISAMFCACLAEPALASLGGGGFFMALPKDSRPYLLDFFVHSPSKPKDLNDIDYRTFICDFGSTQQEFVVGTGTSAVPGCVKGIFDIADQFASMPMTELIQPAVDVLKEGIVVNDMQSLILEVLAPIYVNPTMSKLFESQIEPGTIIKSGEVIRYPDYIDLLETLAIEGEDLFYRGEIAKAIHELSNSGGLITYDDMVNYTAKIRKPLQVEFKQNTVFLNPPPSSGGILIALGLTYLNSINLNQAKQGSAGHIKAVFDALVGLDQLDGEIFHGSNLDLQELSRMYFQTLQKHKQSPSGTTHISIIDNERNAVSVSVSNGEGCGSMIPGTSVMMNNMMGEHDVNPHGLANWRRNTRLSSHMSPSVAVDRDNNLISLGSAGSNRIPTATLQVLMNLIQYRTSAEEAVLNPRIHVHQGEIYLENLPEFSQFGDFFREYDNTTLFPDRNFYFGGVQAARRSGRNIEGCGDVRRGGVAVFVE